MRLIIIVNYYSKILVDNIDVLTVEAKDIATGKSKNLVMKSYGGFSEEDIERMIKGEEEFMEQDTITKERIDAKFGLNSYINSMKNAIEDPEKLKNIFSETDKEIIKNHVSVAQNWLESNPNATREEYEERQKTLERLILFAKH